MDVMFCNAVASARTARLIDEDRLFRMADAADVAEVLKTAQETGFGGEARTINEAIDAEDAALAEFIKGYAPQEKLKAVLLADYDFHNAEALVKAKHLALPSEGLVRPNGVYEVARMKERLNKGEYLDFPIEMREAFTAVDAAFVNGTADGQFVSAEFARAEARYCVRLTKTRRLKKLLTFRIDAVNIQTCARARNYAVAEPMLLPGGKVKEMALRKVCESTSDVIAAEFKMSPYSEYVSALLDALANAKPFVEAERLIGSAEVADLKKDRFTLGGALPFVLYVYYKRAEIANVRIVAAGVAGGLERSAIIERCRDGYKG